MSRLRYFLAAALVAGSMAVCAGAADTADRDALLETAVTHLQQQWQTGNTSAYDKTDDYYASIYSLMPEKNLYELFFSIDVSRHNHGIINMQTGKVIVPPEYDTVERLENDTFLLTKSGQEPNTLDCWFSDTEGNLTVAASGLPGSMICSAGEGMYILASYEKKPVRDVIFYEEPTVTQYDVLQYRLLDSDMNVVRGDLDGGIMVTPPTFHDGLMAVQTGSTLWDGSIKYGAYGNGKYGLIDTTGKFVSANDFDGIQWNYTRIIGKRGDKFYLIAPDGGETALPKNLDQYSAWTTAEVDSAAEHGLSLVNYHYPRLDITRVDFAAQAVQLYRVLTPDGQAAPDETPYSDCDDENVRLAAALGIVTGYEDGTFRPCATITRDGQAAPDETPYSDCDDENVRLAAALGIVTGYEDGTFRPCATITREEAAAMLNRLYEILGGTQTAESRERYADDAQFGAWSRDSIYAMREIGIMKGEENNAFHPAGGYTGEQALVTMERLYNKLHQ